MHSTRTIGKPSPIYVGGILYKSIFVAEVESSISAPWIRKRLKDSEGKPVFIRGTAVVERKWVLDTLATIDNKQTEVRQ